MLHEFRSSSLSPQSTIRSLKHVPMIILYETRKETKQQQYVIFRITRVIRFYRRDFSSGYRIFWGSRWRSMWLLLYKSLLLFLVWEFWKYLLKALHCDTVIVAREAETSQINISSELPTCQQHVNTEYIKWMMGIFWLHAHGCCWLIPTLKSVTVLLLRFGFCFDFILVFLCSLWFTSRYLVIMCFCPPFSCVFVNLCVLFLFYSPHHIRWPP